MNILRTVSLGSNFTGFYKKESVAEKRLKTIFCYKSACSKHWDSRAFKVYSTVLHSEKNSRSKFRNVSYKKSNVN